MYKLPLVSVIVPIYNTEKYIDECVGSLVRQTYENLEILLMNDGSTDNSLRLLDEWCKKDDRLKLHTKKNTGYGDTVNTENYHQLCRYCIDAKDISSVNEYDKTLKEIAEWLKEVI